MTLNCKECKHFYYKNGDFWCDAKAKVIEFVKINSCRYYTERKIFNSKAVEENEREDIMLVVVETPYAKNVERNIKYLKTCLLDCIERGENPYASHLFFTQILDDEDSGQRRLGLRLGFEWGAHAEKCVVYCDLGITKGMAKGISKAIERGQEIEFRWLQNEEKNINN